MIDYARIFVQAGKGGAGKVGWRQDKFVIKGGPDGGNGGKGGSVYLAVDPNLNTLKNFQFQKKFAAEPGQMGGKSRRTGGDGADLIIKVPAGTVVNGKIDLVKPGERYLVAQGGNGGRGNWVFRSPTNTTPKTAEPGGPGQSQELALELKLLANIGLIGLPNAGKSTLLSVLTHARPKIAAYPFTTLEPNLGVLSLGKKNLVLADIPGLIEGASQGKGLGIEFLRHVERCQVLVHLLDATSKTLKADYEQVRQELGQYSQDLLKKPEIIVLNKLDLVAKVPPFKPKAVPISAVAHKNLDALKRMMQLVLTGL
ncbi:MAG: GTPase ObgE [Candidatus Beckwithbacteria bacterium]|nr:GTPase ObgE [Candidatus Beckwithbacteria bacterium]